MNFKINSSPLFTIIFKLKNDNFKTRDFSPLIERVLADENTTKNQITIFQIKKLSKSSPKRQNNLG